MAGGGAPIRKVLLSVFVACLVSERLRGQHKLETKAGIPSYGDKSLLYEGEFVVFVRVVGLHNEEALLLTDDDTVVLEEEEEVESGKVVLLSSVDPLEGIQYHEVGDSN